MTAVPHSVTLDGTTYAIDPARYKCASIPPLRDAAVTSNTPDDALFNPDSAWSRYRYSWHRGAGQTFDDLREDADPYRFNDNYRTDVWTEGRVTLLHSVIEEENIPAATGSALAIASGGYIFYSAASSLYRSSDGASFTALTGPGDPITCLATDGTDLYVGTTTELVRYLGSDTTETAFGTPVAAPSNVAFVGNRLLVGITNVLSECAASGALTTIRTHRQAAFRWQVIFAVGNRIYVGGYAGQRSELYSLTDVGGTLAISGEAAQFPVGEKLLYGMSHAGVVILVSDKGVRIAQPGVDGTLTYGPRIDLTVDRSAHPEGQPAVAEGRFVWVTCQRSVDAVAQASLVRLALDEFTDTLKPAYAWDLEFASSIAPTAVVRFANRTYFTLPNEGLMASSVSLYPTSGWVTSGWLHFGTVEPKWLTNLTVRFDALTANQTVTAWTTIDDTTTHTDAEATDTATSLDADLTAQFSTTMTRATFKVILTGDGNSSLVLRSWRSLGI